VVHLAGAEPPLRENEEVAPIEQTALGEGALERREVDALERPVLVPRERGGEPRRTALEPAGGDVAGDDRHEEQREDGRGAEAQSIDSAPFHEATVNGVAEQDEEQEITRHAPVKVTLTGGGIRSDGGEQNDRHDGEPGYESPLGRRPAAKGPYELDDQQRPHPRQQQQRLSTDVAQHPVQTDPRELVAAARALPG